VTSAVGVGVGREGVGKHVGQVEPFEFVE